MTKVIFLDSCAFDYLFWHRIDIGTELGGSEFQLVVNPSVREELVHIPERPEEPGKKAFIDRLLTGGEIVDRGYFFLSQSALSGGDVLVGIPQAEYLGQTVGELGAPRKSGVPKNATDRVLLSHAIIDSVLTAERTLGNRKLMDEALQRGATVIDITSYKPDTETFLAFLRRHFPAI